MEQQTFNDGILNIYTVGNTAKNGNMPKEELTYKIGPLRYEERTVGMSRYWTAKQANVKVSQLLRVPRRDTVNTDDIAVLSNSMQFRIIQIQYPKGTDIPVMDLSLEKAGVNYPIKQD